MNNFILDNLLFDEFNLNVIEVAVNNLVEPIVVIPQRNDRPLFYVMYAGLPGMVGIIDGCHIEIKQPVNNAVDFFNRKETHSIVLQAVCDDNCLLTDVFIGIPGRVHNARVFQQSPLYHQLVSFPPLILAGQHLEADAAYPLMTNGLKPYRDNGHLSQKQIKFNQTLSAQRSVLEKPFGLIKGR
ncbi:hypothetical protein ILUMI_04613 [Ignelater luminosus]|uniref:DDE Tnp4 domain-containing protein n=1 Tax=Ignelater luminosus TaxID=2038154 RepID=A0A8K0GH66_IGNLU|nr:hypothetical protein ILUMI_04613 [Ignelater luminosus]